MPGVMSSTSPLGLHMQSIVKCASPGPSQGQVYQVSYSGLISNRLEGKCSLVAMHRRFVFVL